MLRQRADAGDEWAAGRLVDLLSEQSRMDDLDGERCCSTTAAAGCPIAARSPLTAGLPHAAFNASADLVEPGAPAAPHRADARPY